MRDVVWLMLRKRAVRFAGGIAALIVAAAAAFVVGQGAWRDLGYIFGFAALLAILMIVRFVVASRKNISAGYNSLGPRTTYTFDERGVQITGDTGEFSIFWNAFSDYTANEKAVVLYQANGSFLIFPTRVFTSEQRTILNTYLHRITNRTR